MDAAIETQGLTRRFGDTTAVQRLDLRVARGEVFGFLGPNGAGKTTTVRLLNGVLSPTEGTARVLGHDVVAEGHAVRRLVGVLTEAPNLYEALTARENLRLYGEIYGLEPAAMARRIEGLLDEFGLRERADDRVGAYSKGMRQRLAIARALLHDPEIVYLDEPTSGLDPAAARMVTGMLKDLADRGGRTVFLCTHNLDEAQRLCHRVGVIAEGMLRALGSPAELARELWEGTWVEFDLRADPDAAVLDILDRLPDVLERRMRDGQLRLLLTDEERVPEAVAAIVGAGGRVYGVHPQPHTLEEIYFRIQQGTDAEGVML